jgi:hypothetical protein
MLLFNPNGHDWIWKYCVNLKMPDHELIHAKTTDNPNLPADYIEQLMNYPEAWRRRFMDGSFDVFTGQIWPEFDPDVHLVNPRPLERGGRSLRALTTVVVTRQPYSGLHLTIRATVSLWMSTTKRDNG